ncbi:MAG: hypothetical protein IJU76_00645 [Desulfovibrionaceae bacterium]|nr:hypothetical protein [Desulfovibrionaceae bacterium]
MTYPSRVRDIQLGQDTVFDAWFYSMLMDNNLAYTLNPHLIASQEQLEFMVQLEKGQIYLPCSDTSFRMLCDKKNAKELQQQYNRAWRIIVSITKHCISDAIIRRRLFQFLRLRFQQYTAQKTLLPSRLVKRMTDLITQQAFGTISDPWIEPRRMARTKHEALYLSKEIQEALDAVVHHKLPPSIAGIRQDLNGLELVRLFALTLLAPQWADEPPSSDTVRAAFAQAENRAGSLPALFTESGKKQATILVLADPDGSTFFELRILRALRRMGNKLIYAVKKNYYFMAPTIADVQEDPIFAKYCKDAQILEQNDVSKNELLKELKAHKFIIISDGTRERLNLYRVSVTFARAWKEADCILAHGWRAKDIFLDTSHEFTRDIVCFWHDSDGFHIVKKEHSAKSHKFSEQDISDRAKEIIATMRDAHRAKKTVMFFSCIIGSIPGETALAISLATVFVDDLRKKLENVLIINPAEYFVPGMDGDDLMYMWERVQRSGEIDIWRFQSSEDIEQSFALLGRKVPPIWSGKDSTYSTGCTKEMKIALDVQNKNPEMQIIGPDPKRFFRRGEYGVGKYFDAHIRR